MEITRLSLMRFINRKPLVVGGLIFLLLGMTALGLWRISNTSSPGATTMDNRIDILKGGWEYMPGTVTSANGLRVSYLGRSIVQQDGSVGQINPAVNLYGSHLRATNNFTLTAAIANRKGNASFRLYAAPPVVQDEFRVESKSLDFIVSDSKITINEWFGYDNQNLMQQEPGKSTDISIKPNTTQTLAIQRSGDNLSITIDGEKLTDLKYSDYFNKDIWIGLDAVDKNDDWTLSQLFADSTAKDTIVLVNTQHNKAAPQSQALQSLAAPKRPDFLIGAATSLASLVSDTQYYDLSHGGNFGLTTTENALKWQFIHPQQNVYNFKEADAFVSLAHKNNLKVQGHTLVFGEANPKWVQDLPTETPNDKENIKQVMVDHITQTVSHFKDKIYAWDVVNEPLADDESDTVTLRSHKWLASMGEDYIAIAFNAARAADPSARLYINDFGLEEDGPRWDAMLALVTRLKMQGVPIDGVGFEAHVYESGDEIDPAILRTHIKQLADIGLSSHISEMDVHSDNGEAVQAKQYADVFEVCLSEPTCTSWSTWGVSDKYNLYTSDSGTLESGKDFLWDNQYKPKPAVSEIRKILSN
ncbi:MAG: endo-1,4-beta-xylanase [Candidatus Saccharimonadales bacterium]